MALSSGTTAHIVDAIAEAAPARVTNANPLKNKIVHADIRIQSIEDEPKQDGLYLQSDEPQSRPSLEDAAEQKHQSEMQMWWDEAIAKNLNLPDGYSKVAVLLIRWADEIDDLQTGKEAKDLETLFRDRFHYQTKTIELHVRQKPQHLLNSHVSDFIRDNDGSRNLLIVYYTGHGVYRDDKKCLELTGSINPSVEKGFRKDARCNWDKAEEILRDEEVEGDVLTILDTCYSSNIVVKSGQEHKRKFELLSACSIDSTTSSGSNSFTRALIDALEGLLKEYKDSPFSTFRLNQRILLDKRRSDTPSHLWSRMKSVRQNEQHILLAPLKPPKADVLPESRLRLLPKGYLTLRFGLRDASLNQEQIEFMTRALSRAFSGSKMVGLRKIEWLDMKSAPPAGHFERFASVMFFVKQWKRVIERRKEQRKEQEQRQRLAQRSVDHVTFSKAMEVDPATSPTKRRHDDGGESPDLKRRYLEASQAPSPPISDTSRIDDDN